MNTDQFFGQVGIFDPEKQRSDIWVVGAGSTGSFIALTLAKMGFSQIRVVDFDKVEAHNIPNQFYRTSDVGENKVMALGEIISEFTDNTIFRYNYKVDDDFQFDLNANSIVVNCVDNLEARSLVYEKIKDYPIKLVDTRMGGEGFSIHVVDLADETQRKKYEESLVLTPMETPCGMKGVIYTILSIAAETANIVKRIDQNERYPTILKREMKTYRFLSDA